MLHFDFINRKNTGLPGAFPIPDSSNIFYFGWNMITNDQGWPNIIYIKYLFLVCAQQ